MTMRDEPIHVGDELVPLSIMNHPRTSTSYSSQRSNSSDVLGSLLSPTTTMNLTQQQQQNNNNYNNASTKAAHEMEWMALQFIGCLAFGLTGWYLPRYMIRKASDDIVKKPVPYQTTQAGDVILDGLLNQQNKDPATVPSTLLIWSSVYIPLIIVVVTAWFITGKKNGSSTTTTTSSSSSRRQRFHDTHAAFCAFVMTVGLSEGATQILKLYIQRKRPCFYALCGFDKAQRICTAREELIVEANFSFPSGHSSLSCCGMMFLVLFLLGKIIASNHLSPSAKRICGMGATCLPLSWTLFVAASRLVDQWHHPADVIAGLLLGGLCAMVVYHVWYPPVWWASSAGMPWSILVSPNGSRSSSAATLKLMEGGKLASFHE